MIDPWHRTRSAQATRPMFEDYYTERFRQIFGTPLEPSDGLGRDAVRSALARIGCSIPAALADYHALAGRHWINDNHNRLRPIDQLEWVGDKLVFIEENQCVAQWAVDGADLAEADPVVWQGDDGEPIRWYPEDRRLSRFLMAMWRWTMTGQEDPADAGRSEV